MTGGDILFVYVASALLIAPGVLLGIRASRAFAAGELLGGRLSTERRPVQFALLISLMFGVAGGLIILGVWFPGEVVNLHYE